MRQAVRIVSELLRDALASAAWISTLTLPSAAVGFAFALTACWPMCATPMPRPTRLWRRVAR